MVLCLLESGNITGSCLLLPSIEQTKRRREKKEEEKKNSYAAFLFFIFLVPYEKRLTPNYHHSHLKEKPILEYDSIKNEYVLRFLKSFNVSSGSETVCI